MERLKELRIDANMTQEGLAAATDLTQSTISRLERGGRRPRPKTLGKLAYALSVQLEDLDPDLADAYRPRPAGQMPDKVAKPLLSLADALARKYARWEGERAELRSAGQEGLWEAWSKFDPDKGVPFEKFAGPRIKWRVLDRRRKLLKDPTTKAYGFETQPRWVREFIGIGSSAEEENDKEE